MHCVVRPASLLPGLLLFGGSLWNPAAASRSTPDCKAFPGDRSWPSPSTWDDLDATLRGQGANLLIPRPPGAVCHADQPEHDLEACEEAKTRWATYDFHAEHPASMMWDTFTNETCMPDAARSCSRDGYPAYVVNATTADHVKTAIDFAREHNVRLVVHSTGHDFLGRSSGAGSLSIWIHHMRGVVHHEGSFTLSQTGGQDQEGLVIPGSAVTVQGGTMMNDIYRATHEHGEVVVGGLARTVGVGGFITGGGHSRLSPEYGLAADQVLQMEVVTPKGDIVVANELQNTDLFWAMRGGGGSTFGVITSVTLKTFPTRRVLSSDMALVIEDLDAPYLWDVVALFMTELPRFVDAGLCGIFSSSLVSPDGQYEGAVEGGSSLLPPSALGFVGQMIAHLDEGDAGEVKSHAAAASLAAFNETLKSRWPEAVAAGDLALRVESKTFPSWYEWWDAIADGQQIAGFSALTGSWLLGKEDLDKADPEVVKEALRSVSAQAHIGLMPHMVGGKGVMEAVPRGGSNSVNPAWRKAYNHLLFANMLPPVDEKAWKESADLINKILQPIRDLSPDSGAYLNEAHKYQRDYQKVFWGDNYDRLAMIKKQMDPEDVFWCHPCVGNEGWEERWDGHLCRVKATDNYLEKSEL
ncbi:unnamed protein product [Clonostachys rosea]|uniref:FAD-binding PCMH-type domain-containing protein n=1 Tax=Bionectria ochroleuca TaxID=29856 RepID=A0ABY6TXA5_BIOOC|nr:unnamed protein product [Clonostachys rosea]